MKQEREGKRVLRYILLLAAVISVFTVMAPKPVSAAPQVVWQNGENETEISVEAGSKFYIGDFVTVFGENVASTASLQKSSYRTQNKKIAAVNGKGYLNAKKAGTADITVRCQGVTLVCHLTVEKKGTFEQTTAIKELKTAAKTLAKGLPKKLSAAKAYSLRKKKEEYLSDYGHFSSRYLTYEGFLYEQGRLSPSSMNAKRSEKLAVPEAGRYLTAAALLRQFMLTNDPTSIRSKKTMRIATASANGKSGKITIKLAQKLKAEQITAAQLAYSRLNQIDGSKKTAIISMTVYDETAGKYYTGRPVLKQGSKQIVVQPMESVYGGFQAVELEKGHVYMLESELSWAKGTKVTIK